MKKTNKPLVSIGIPIFNEENNIKKMINPILNQTYRNCEILISDNASTDKTSKIINFIKKKDRRIKVFVQKINIGGPKNFNFILHKAKGKYFFWSSADDIRSIDFIEKNVNFLESHEEFVGSTSPNCFDEKDLVKNKLINFSLIGTMHSRILKFIKNAMISHGIFYGLFRTKILKKCPFVGENFLARDWAIVIFLLRYGNINRIKDGFIIIGTHGISNTNPWKPFRTNIFYWLFPLFKLIYYSKNIKSFKIMYNLFLVNFKFARFQFLYEFYPRYIRIRSYLKGFKSD